MNYSNTHSPSQRIKNLRNEKLKMQNTRGQLGLNILTSKAESPMSSIAASNDFAHRRFSMSEIESAAMHAGNSPLSKPSPLIKRSDPSTIQPRAGSIIKYGDDATGGIGKKRNLQSIIQPQAGMIANQAGIMPLNNRADDQRKEGGLFDDRGKRRFMHHNQNSGGSY